MPMDIYLLVQTCGVAPPCELPIIITRIPGFSNALSLHLVVNCCHKMAQLQQSVYFVELQCTYYIIRMKVLFVFVIRNKHAL